MIDRKTFWIVMVFASVMLTAAAWRVSLLPDWTHMPRYGVNGAAMPPISSAILLMLPGALVFSMVAMFGALRVYTPSDGATKSWHNWIRLYLIPFGAILTLMQAFLITRSLGLFLAMNPLLLSRAFIVVMGGLLIVVGNVLPKLPWLASPIRFFNLDPDSHTKLRRFQGWFYVVLGFVMMMGGAFLPIKLFQPVILSLTAAGAVVGLFFRIATRRGQPQ